MKKFNKRLQQLLEDPSMGNTTSGVLGPTQGHSTNVGQSGDFYAPGDNRNLFGTTVAKPGKKSKFKPPGFKKGKVIRRTFPGM